MDVVKPFVKDPRTDADVNLVLNGLGELSPDGRVITHKQVEALLRVPRTHSHYKLVMKHVRCRIEDERSLVLDGRGLKGEGWLLLTRPEQVSRGHRGVALSIRSAKKQTRRMSMPLAEELPESMRAFRAGFVASMSRVFHAHEQAQKDTRLMPGAVKSLPRLPLNKET